jgi:hypothetical protein
VERTDLRPETLGLSLAEAKDLQQLVVERQASTHLTLQRRCPDCGQLRPIKGYHDLAWRTLFGQLTIHSHGCTTAPAGPMKPRPSVC